MKLRFWYLLTGATRSSYTTWLLLPQVVHRGPLLALTRFVFLQDTAVTEPRLNISVAKCKPGRWSRPASTSSKNRYAQQVRWSSVSAVFTHFCPGPVNFSPPAARRTGRGAAAAAAQQQRHRHQHPTPPSRCLPRSSVWWTLWWQAGPKKHNYLSHHWWPGHNRLKACPNAQLSGCLCEITQNTPPDLYPSVERRSLGKTLGAHAGSGPHQGRCGGRPPGWQSMLSAAIPWRSFAAFCAKLRLVDTSGQGLSLSSMRPGDVI